ncbi:MAG: type 1 glutamine amidotransferase [Candidatus Uhrbacteria bacterium]
MKISKKIKDLNILVLQFRTGAMKAHEQQCLLRVSGFDREQCVFFDCVKQEPKIEMLKDYDFLLIGGSGDITIGEEEIPVLNIVYQIVRQARAMSLPTIGICFGAHILTKAFGGELSYDKEGMETGTFQITLTDESQEDPVFSKLAKQFDAQLGHKDFISRLPSGAVCLATSELSGVQAWAFPNEPLYAIQFHPELEAKDVVTRLNFYAKQYLDDNLETYEKIKKDLRPSPEAVKVIKYYLKHFIGA